MYNHHSAELQYFPFKYFKFVYSCFLGQKKYMSNFIVEHLIYIIFTKHRRKMIIYFAVMTFISSLSIYRIDVIYIIYAILRYILYEECRKHSLFCAASDNVLREV